MFAGTHFVIGTLFYENTLTTVKDQKNFKILKCRALPILKLVEYDGEVYFFKKKMESSEI